MPTIGQGFPIQTLLEYFQNTIPGYNLLWTYRFRNLSSLWDWFIEIDQNSRILQYGMFGIVGSIDSVISGHRRLIINSPLFFKFFWNFRQNTKTYFKDCKDTRTCIGEYGRNEPRADGMDDWPSKMPCMWKWVKYIWFWLSRLRTQTKVIQGASCESYQ